MPILRHHYVISASLCIFLSIFHNASSHAIRQHSSSRMKRSEDTQSCFESRYQCKSNATCKRAFRNVVKKCKFANGQCNADLLDIGNCVEDIETIWSMAFNRNHICSCSPQKLSIDKLKKCHDVHNVVHVNPCYDKGKMLRPNRSPNFIDSAVSVKSNIKTTSNPSHVTETTGNQIYDQSTALIIQSTIVKTSPKHQTFISRTSTEAELIVPSSHLSCSGKLLITGGVFLFFILMISVGTVIYCKRKCHSGYIKGTGVKKRSLYSYIRYTKNNNNKTVDDRKE